MKKSLTLMLALIMVLCMIPTTAFAKSSSASLTVSVRGTFYNPNTDKHEYFSNLRTITHVNVNEGEHPSYPVKYYFTKQTYYGSTNSSYYGKEGYKLIVTIGGKESTDLNAWVFDRDMTNVKGDGQTFYPIYNSSGYGTYTNNLSISGGTPIQPETGTLTINKTVTGLPNDKLPASFTFNVMQGNNVKATVTVNKNGNNGYNAGSATLPHGTYTVVEVSATVDGYTVVTTPSNGEVTISGQPTNITFTNAYTENEPQPETPPAQPDPGPSATPTIDGLTGVQVVEVKCITENSGHAKQAYQLIEGSYAVGEVQGDKESGYTCDITVNPGEYVKAYNTKIGVTHTLDPESQTGTIKLSWNGTDKKWELANPGDVLVEFTVKCDTVEPNDPPKPNEDDILRIVGNGAVKVHCDANTEHEDKIYGLLEGSFDIGDVTKDEVSGEYFCNITVHAGKYVDEYNKTYAGHTLATAGQTGMITLKWQPDVGGDGTRTWVVASNVPVVFTVKCEDVETYTVTYKDGVGGTAFKDQVHPGLKLGDATPGFTGTPYRWNYTFTGWKPAVAPTVSGDAVYTAQWSYNGGGWTPSYPINPVPPVVVVPPKTGDMPFWYSIAQFLGLVK